MFYMPSCYMCPDCGKPLSGHRRRPTDMFCLEGCQAVVLILDNDQVAIARSNERAPLRYTTLRQLLPHQAS